jgi:hypothetical protein
MCLLFSQEATGIKSRQQRIVYGGIQLAPAGKLRDYGVEPGKKIPPHGEICLDWPESCDARFFPLRDSCSNSLHTIRRIAWSAFCAFFHSFSRLFLLISTVAHGLGLTLHVCACLSSSMLNVNDLAATGGDQTIHLLLSLKGGMPATAPRIKMPVRVPPFSFA